jgi:ParB-like chromosome segregation protein Spo0J
MRLNDLGTGKLEAPKLDPLIVIIRPGNNYREMTSPAVRAHIDWLKTSIREEGVKKPIDVEFIEGKVYLVAGECRLTAAQELRNEGWDGTIPAFAVRGDEADILAKSIIDNAGLPPTLLEFGQAVQRLVNYGWELEKVAKYVPAHVADTPKRALQFVKDALELHQAPLAVKEAVRSGVDGVEVSPALALSATRHGRLTAPETIKEAVADAKAKGKKVATRPKGEGVATKAKKKAEAETDTLLKRGDRMAKLILAEGTDWESLEKAAKSWQKERAHVANF